MISAKARKQTVLMVRPPARLKISEWADKNAFIPNEGNAEPGKYRLSRMPHQAEMLDDPIEPGVRESFWMLASQAGGKTMGLILICEFIIHQLRKSILMVRATKETAQEWMRDKFMPTVEATPCMAGLMKDPRARGSGSTSSNRKFPGGGLKTVGAKSPASFRGSSVGKVFCDEIDSYEVTKEGDPCALADRAAITFPDSWKIKASTPTLKDFSRIDQGYQRGDQKKYFLPCVCCGEFQWLKTEQLKFSFSAEEKARFGEGEGDAAPTPETANGFTWEIGDFSIRDPKRAIYVCEHCHRGWTDAQRIQAYLSGHAANAPVVVNGKELRAHWRATAPFTGIRSRQLSGMYLTIGLKPGMTNYLHWFAEDFLSAKRGGRETLMVWTNIFKCEAFEDPHEKTDWKTLQERSEDYGLGTAETGPVPLQVMWIAFGADVQTDRVEILSYGWGDGQEAWALERQVIYGDFDMPGMQSRVEDYLLNKRFTHSILGEMGFSAGAIDSGHQTRVKAVYQFCAKHTARNFWSVKGFDNALGAVYQPVKEKVYGGRRFNLNVDYFKTLIFDRLRNKEPGPRYIHFPAQEGRNKVNTGFDAGFYMQLCSERRIPVKQARGGIVHQWVKLASSTRNEVLDMTVYAFAVFEICRQEEWIARKWKEVHAKIKELNPPAKVEGPGEGKTYVLGGPPAMAEKKMPGLEPATRRGPTPAPRSAGRKRIRVRSPFRM